MKEPSWGIISPNPSSSIRELMFKNPPSLMIRLFFSYVNLKGNFSRTNHMLYTRTEGDALYGDTAQKKEMSFLKLETFYIPSFLTLFTK